MRALIVSCVFPPEPVVSSQTSFHVAQEMARHGHDVVVITSFPNRPSGKLFPGYSRRIHWRKRDDNNYEIRRCFSFLSSESRMMSRFLENVSFGLTSGWAALTTKRPDVIYANTWPIVATGILFLVTKIRLIPLIINVQDLYPESLIAQQRVRENCLLGRWMRWVDSVIARNCRHVIVISERFAEIYRAQRKVRPGRLSLIPNWIEKDLIDMEISGAQWRSSKGIGDKDFLLVYGGNVGKAAGVEAIIESMSYLSREIRIRLLVAGSGSRLSACQELAGKYPNKSIIFHSPWLKNETSEVLRSADLLILPTHGRQSLVSVPSKLLSYMLSARPIIATALPGSDLSKLVEKSRCGWVIEPDCPELLAYKIRDVANLDPAERQSRGNMGREFVLRYFTKESCLPRIVRILEEAAQS